MKRIINTLVVFSLLFAFLIPQIAYASDNTDAPEWTDISISDSEFEAILENNPNNQISKRSTGLIDTYSIAVSKSGSNLLIAGRTTCSTDVTKCGLKEVIIQRRKNSSSSWSDYKTYDDLYTDGHTYILSKSIAVASGYQYRVTCTHYDKKNLFSTQKINNVSNVVTI